MNILAKLELDVKKQFELDPFDENMYLTIKRLTEKILVVRRLIEKREDVEVVAHEYATVLWTRICHGVVIDHWIGYILLNILTPLHDYYDIKETDKDDLVLTDPVDRESFTTTMYGPSDTREYVRTFEVEDYLSSLYLDIRDDVLKFSRYTDININRLLYLSVLSNLVSEKSVIGLPDEYAEYVEFLTKLIRRSTYQKALESVGNPMFQSISEVLSSEDAYNYVHSAIRAGYADYNTLAWE